MPIFPFWLLAGGYIMSELSILSALEKACDLIDAQLAAGMEEAVVKETLARSYEARIAAYPSLHSRQTAALTYCHQRGPTVQRA